MVAMRDAGGARDAVLVADNATLSRRPRIDFPPSLPVSIARTIPVKCTLALAH